MRKSFALWPVRPLTTMRTFQNPSGRLKEQGAFKREHLKEADLITHLAKGSAQAHLAELCGRNGQLST